MALLSIKMIILRNIIQMNNKKTPCFPKQGGRILKSFHKMDNTMKNDIKIVLIFQ